jgi:hypothetical protein
MVVVSHEVGEGLFCQMLEEKMVAQGLNSFVLVWLKSARFGLASLGRLKEGDVAYKRRFCTF